VVNVGAGSGSYEPADRDVTAVEPSEVMIAQRPPGSAPVVRAVAEALPFANGSFDATTAILTIHHWQDLAAGLGELRRVARDRVVVVMYDAEVNLRLWIIRDYLPEIVTGHARFLPSVADVVAALPGASVEPILVARDCSDRMFGTLWGRPEDYFDPDVRRATSVWQLLPPGVAERAVSQPRDDLASGRWDERHGHLRELPELDTGLRLVISRL
jgi:SAM-dependent methyltransferase